MSAGAQVSTKWPQHSMDRPEPTVVDPGPFKASAPPPTDAIVLFDGRSLANWRSADSANLPARWKVADGYMEIAAGTGSISTKQAFGDVQLHLEWRAPTPAKGEGQERGNSGVILMGLYEVQVLDSYHNRTYADGSAGAVYGQFPPLVNASRPPGEWQTYDIVFHRPRFDRAGLVELPARMTVFHNGDPGRRSAQRPHGAPDASTLQAPRRRTAPHAPGPRRSGAVPEYLDSKTVMGRRGKGKREAVSPFPLPPSLYEQ
jgi:hypothetical protein